MALSGHAAPAEQAYRYALAHLPGLAPPSPDILPNFVNPYNGQYLIVLATGIALTAATSLVLIRTYTRKLTNKIGLGWDDCKSILLNYSYSQLMTGDY